MIPHLHENIKYQSDIDIIFRISTNYGNYVTKHWHNSLEIIYVLEGTLSCITGDNTSHTVESGDFIVINSREIHAINNKGPVKSMLLQIPYGFLKKYIPKIDNIRFRCTMAGHSPDSRTEYGHIIEYLSAICQLYPLKTDEYILRFYGWIFELLFHLHHFFREEISPEEKKKSAKYIQRLGHITTYVREHYAENISLQQIADEVSLNPDYFTRFFKKYMGMTFLDYVNSIRLEYINADLLETDLSIQSLLELHGFTNYKLFIKMYKTRYGCTPGQMRKRIIH